MTHLGTRGDGRAPGRTQHPDDEGRVDQSRRGIGELEHPVEGPRDGHRGVRRPDHALEVAVEL
jgi:hypothetical protein